MPPAVLRFLPTFLQTFFPSLGPAGLRRAAAGGPLAAALILSGCASEPVSTGPTPAQARASIAARLPPATKDREGWAADIQVAFAALKIAPTPQNVCTVVAVTEQESGFRTHPTVPRLAQITWQEIERRAAAVGVPGFVVRTALRLDSPDGRSYAERIDAAKTENELSEIFEDFIGMVPMGQRLFAGLNPVRTGGPMQVRIDFAERHAADKTYPYPVEGSLRREVFTRRGGMYFGIAHLLDYPADYEHPRFRVADFNAGQHASRNAAFQNALSRASGIPLELDGDLLPSGDAKARGRTELAAQAVAERIGMSESAIRRALEQGRGPGFEDTRLHERVFELAEKVEGRTLPRAMVPRIRLQSPKITRNLTTEWFVGRVEGRLQRCLARGG